MALRLIIVTLFIFSMISKAMAGSLPIGMFLTDEKDCALVLGSSFKDKCKTDTKEDKCKADTEIYEGDKIRSHKEIKNLNIQWRDPSSVSIKANPCKNTKVTEYTPSLDIVQEEDNLITRWGDITGFLKKISRRVAVSASAVTKGDPNKKRKIQLPGEFASLLPHTPITFAWCDNAAKGIRTLIVSNSAGEKTFEAKVEGATSFTTLPEKLAIKPGQTYNWKVEGLDCTEGKIRLLDDKKAGEILEVLEKIKKQKTEDREKLLETAFYLQLVSDYDPEEISLYWLSYQLLTENAASFHGDDADTASFLKFTSDIRTCLP